MLISNSPAVYKIECLTTGKVYIGSSIKKDNRWNSHRRALCAKKHHNIKLQNAWNKYGTSEFEFSTLLYCDIKNLLFYEQICIDHYDAVKTGYNIAPVAGSTRGVVASLETRKKISAASKGRNLSDEAKLKVSLANKGKTLSAEHKAKISSAHIGKTLSAERKAKLSSANTGRVMSAEHKAKLLAVNTGRKQSAETRAKISFGNIGISKNKGRKHSVETKAKLSAIHKGRKYGDRVVSVETRQKMSAAAMGNRNAKNKLLSAVIMVL